MQAASDQQREQLREQMKKDWTEFREAQKQRIQELKEELRRLKDQFQDDRSRLLDAAKEQGPKARGRSAPAIAITCC